MKNSELFDLIRKFSPEEINEFEKYLRSPFFVNGTSLNKMFKEIIKYKELLLSFDYNRISFKLSKKLKYSNTTLSKQLSLLSSQVINFLKIKAIQNNSVLQELTLNEYLLNQKYFSVLSNNLKKFSSKINDSQLFINEKSFLWQYIHNSLCFTFQIYNPGFGRKKFNDDAYHYLFNSAEDILLYSYTQSVSIYVNYILLNIHQSNKKLEKHISKLNSVLLQIDISQFFEHCNNKKNVFEIYKNMYFAFHDLKNKNNFINYKQSVKSNINILDEDLRKFHYGALIGYCTMHERLGIDNLYYKKECAYIIMEYFDKNYYKTGNVEFIDQVEFYNFIGEIYLLKDYELIKSFIEKNSSKLRPSEYNDMVNYGLSYYYFGIKEYRKVLKCINNINKSNSYIKFDIRNMELKVYYELGKIETLIDTIHNYRKIILNDNELTKNDKQSLLTLIKYINILININNKTNKQEQSLESNYYKKIIEKEPYFALKLWILEKFENLLSDINSRKYPKAKLINE